MEIVEVINPKDNVKEFIEEKLKKCSKGSNTLQKTISLKS